MSGDKPVLQWRSVDGGHWVDVIFHPDGVARGFDEDIELRFKPEFVPGWFMSRFGKEIRWFDEAPAKIGWLPVKVEPVFEED